MPQETIAIAADHAGFEMKELLKADLAARRIPAARPGHEWTGVGSSSLKYRAQ